MNKLLSIITILTLLLSHAVHAKVDKDVNVAKVQAMLAELCYEPGIVDGAWGKKTETAVKAFFAKHYRKYDGNFDVSDANFILSAGASAKAFGSASVKKCLVVYSNRIGNSLNNEKIKQITPGSGTGTKNIQSCDYETGRNYQTREDIKGDGKWLDKDTQRALSQIALNGLEKNLISMQGILIDKMFFLSLKKREEKLPNFPSNMLTKDINLTGNVWECLDLRSDTRFS